MTTSDPRAFSDQTHQRDADRVRAAVGGDREAFGQLVSCYQQRAVSVAYRLLGNRDDAVEAAQEAFLRAFQSLARLEKPERFGPWLMRIVSNLSLNVRRSRRSGPTVTLDETQGIEGGTTGGEPVANSPSPDDRTEHQELQQALEVALETLPEKQRLSLVLFTIEGWAQKDIAELLACSVENVKWNVFQARKRLREQLGDRLNL